NFYSVPFGTHRGKGSFVIVRQEDNKLVIMKTGSLDELCRHTIPAEKGLKVLSTDHRRNKEVEVEVLMLEVANLFSNPIVAKHWLEEIYKVRARYMRDQLQLIQQVLAQTGLISIANDAMHFCHRNNIYSASDFKAIVQQHVKATKLESCPDVHILNPLTGNKLDKHVQPEKSHIEDYQQLF